MAVYKVLQDVEAEDKLLGPLTLKGFIYVAITALLAFIDIRLIISGAPIPIKIIFTVLFLPPMLLFGVLASPLGREQPTEVWLLSRIRFMLKPRRRQWDQLGINDLVKITAPKKIERVLTKDITQTEVSSRLKALANTLDSRGWAVKNVAINLDAKPVLQAVEAGDERLAGASTLVEPEPVLDVHEADDILDEQNNPTAQNFDSMIQKAEEERKLALQKKLEAARSQAAQTEQIKTKMAADPNALTAEEKALLDKIHAEQNEFKLHPPIIRPGASRGAVTAASQTVKLDLAHNGNDLSVASIARLVNRNQSDGLVGPA